MEFKELLQQVAVALELTPEEIMERSRERIKVEARYILYLLLDKLHEHPTQIARRFKQDRTTIITGRNKALYLLEDDRYFKRKYEKCIGLLPSPKGIESQSS